MVQRHAPSLCPCLFRAVCGLDQEGRLHKGLRPQRHLRRGRLLLIAPMGAVTLIHLHHAGLLPAANLLIIHLSCWAAAGRLLLTQYSNLNHPVRSQHHFMRVLFIVYVSTPCATLARGRGGRRGGRVSSGILQWMLWWMAMLAPGLTASPTLIDDRRGSSRAVAR